MQKKELTRNRFQASSVDLIRYVSLILVENHAINPFFSAPLARVRRLERKSSACHAVSQPGGGWIGLRSPGLAKQSFFLPLLARVQLLTKDSSRDNGRPTVTVTTPAPYTRTHLSSLPS